MPRKSRYITTVLIAAVVGAVIGWAGMAAKRLPAIMWLVVFVLVGLNFAAEAQFDADPPAPLPISQHSEYGNFDVQVHSRDAFGPGINPVMGQHGTDCSGPPNVHPVSTYEGAVYVCRQHVMTALNEGGYGLIVLTPNQTIDCTVSCAMQWEQSTLRMSARDWVDFFLTNYADNLALPFDDADVDLQKGPRNTIHLDFASGESYPSIAAVGANRELLFSLWDEKCCQAMDAGIPVGANQAADRQPFRLSIIAPNLVRFERLAGPNGAPPVVYYPQPGSASVNVAGVAYKQVPTNLPLSNAMVMQFLHHSYNPEKDNSCHFASGTCSTWHWDNMAGAPATPFTLIHANQRATSGGNITFPAGAPNNAYLRFAAWCKVSINGQVVQPQVPFTHAEHANSYFVPIAFGTNSVNVQFSAQDWYGGPCIAQDFTIWAKGGAPLPTPTSSATPTITVVPSTTPVPPTPSSTSVPTATSTATATAVPSATATPAPATSTPTRSPTPSPTATSTPSPTPTQTPIRRQCTLRWGNTTIVDFGRLTEAQCDAIGAANALAGW